MSGRPLLVLGEDDVRALLEMDACIEAMERALAGLARGELMMPLRFVVKPGGETLMGLMPAYRGGEAPLFTLKDIVIAPGNSRGGDQVEASSLEKIANELNLRLFSRSSTASCLPSGERTRPGSQRNACG